MHRIIFVALLITGCSESADTLNTLDHYLEIYCDSTSDSLAKKFAIDAIQSQLPGYPEEGICSGVEPDGP